MMRQCITLLCALAGLVLCACKQNGPACAEKAAQKYDIAAYYWPAWHPDPRWQEIGIFPDGKGEWQNIYEAKPKFIGHEQPRVPVWGYEDESGAQAMTKRIDTASEYGVNVFLFDWYWYDGRPFLEAPLNRFVDLKTDKMKFYIMWANHDVHKSGWSNKVHLKTFPPEDLVWSAQVDLPEFKKVADRLVEKYFTQPNYYKIDGEPVLSFYDVRNLVEGLGGVEKTKEAFEYIDAAAKKAGLKGVHIQFIAMGMPQSVLQGVPGNNNAAPKDMVEYLGVKSLTSYSWVHYQYSNGLNYSDWGDFNVKNWGKIKTDFPNTPFYNNVSIGWDNNARYPHSRLTPIVFNSNPAKFGDYIKQAMEWTDAHHPNGPKLITINAWNEWPEGSYLEPDMRNGYGYLEALRRALKSGECKK